MQSGKNNFGAGRHEKFAEIIWAAGSYRGIGQCFCEVSGNV